VKCVTVVTSGCQQEGHTVIQTVQHSPRVTTCLTRLEMPLNLTDEGKRQRINAESVKTVGIVREKFGDTKYFIANFMFGAVLVFSRL